MNRFFYDYIDKDCAWCVFKRVGHDRVLLRTYQGLKRRSEAQAYAEQLNRKAVK